MSDYEYFSTPFAHQKKLFTETRDWREYALFWEQGCGKTKPIIDTAVWLYEQKKVDTLLVLAPNGVHRNWIEDELNKHLPSRMWTKTKAMFWSTAKQHTKTQQALTSECLRHPGLLVFTMSYDSVMTEKGRDTLWSILSKRTPLYVLDESSYIKNWNKRTKRVTASGRHATYKRILDGTPVSNSPFDIYWQMIFLDENFWKPHGLGSFGAFKTQFGEFFPYKSPSGAEVQLLKHYKNLETLNEMITGMASRLLKEDVLDLPPKLYSKRYFDLNSEQARIYRELKEEMRAEIGDMIECEMCNGAGGDCPRCHGIGQVPEHVVDVNLAIVRMLRLHQVTRGYIPVEKDEPVHMIGDENPCLKLFREVVNEIPHKGIVWCKYTLDVDLVLETLRKDGHNPVRYDGLVSEDERAANKQAFQEGDADWFVAKPTVGATGITLTAARTAIYYSQDFSLRNRKQSEDRCHRIGQEHPVNYIDLVGIVDGSRSIDDYIVKSLLRKDEASAKVLGDKVRSWL